MSFLRECCSDRSELKICSTHSDTTLAMLRRGGGTDVREEKVLGPWEWSENEAILHWDQRAGLGSVHGDGSLTVLQFMPVRRRAYSGELCYYPLLVLVFRLRLRNLCLAWNYLTSTSSPNSGSVTSSSNVDVVSL